MAAEKTFNRWLVVVGAMLIQVSLGAVYIYSVFKPSLSAKFPSWSPTDLALPSQLILAFFALGVIFAGKIQDKIGPRIVANYLSTEGDRRALRDGVRILEDLVGRPAFDRLRGRRLAPPIPDFIKAMGRTNDAIIYGGRVQLFVRGDDAAAKKLAEALPSSSSSAYGKPFAEIFAEVQGDFYKIDAMLFSPALVTVSNLDTGSSFHAGKLAPDIVDASFR